MSLKLLLDKPDEMGRPEKPVAQRDIDDFERSQGLALPAPLKSFWLAYGARSLGSKTIYTFKAGVVFPNGRKKNADVGAIAGPKAMIETRQRYIDPIYGNSGPRLPDGLYPLTFDDGYGHCLIDLNAGTCGRILYIAIKAKTFGSPGYGWDEVGTVADDFQEFLAGLTPDFL